MAKNWRFWLKTKLNYDRNIGFWENRKLFRRKLLKIAENFDHKIDPGFFHSETENLAGAGT
jgi:hypothetical protein